MATSHVGAKMKESQKPKEPKAKRRRLGFLPPSITVVAVKILGDFWNFVSALNF